LIFNFTVDSLRRAEQRRPTALIICHCRTATDREIRRAVRDGATNLRDVGSKCGAASACGGCAEAVLEIIATELGSAPRAIDYDRSTSQS
jgi:bacterioferritin-associated ferredoxin